jgi:hypothetical protein
VTLDSIDQNTDQVLREEGEADGRKYCNINPSLSNK